MMRRVPTSFLAAVLLLTLPATAWAQVVSTAATAEARTFAAEADAIKGCGSDPVVWVNKKNGIYHLKTSRWYGKTREGAYGCQSEMDKAGHHQAKDSHAQPTQPAPPK